MRGEASSSAHDDDMTWRERVWLAFLIRQVGITRDPLHALRRMVQEAILERRWAAAFALAALLDDEEAALTEAPALEHAHRRDSDTANPISQERDGRGRASAQRLARLMEQWKGEETERSRDEQTE